MSKGTANPTLLLNQLIPVPEALQLGRLVRKIDEPHQDFCAVLDHIIDPVEIIKGTLSDISAVASLSSSTSIGARLTRLLSSSHNHENSRTVDLTAKTLRTYQLKNSRKWFITALRQMPAKTWIEEAIKDGVDMYFVVGYHTAQGLQVFQSDQTGSENVAKGAIEPQDALGLTASEAVARLGAGVWGTRHSTNHVTLGFKSEDSAEHAFGIQYRKLKFKVFSRKTVESVKLEEGNVWKIMWGLRGQEGVDFLEVDFDDPEVEFKGTHGWKSETVGATQYVFREEGTTSAGRNDEDEDEEYEEEYEDNY